MLPKKKFTELDVLHLLHDVSKRQQGDLLPSRKISANKKEQRHFWLLILWFIWYVFSCGNGLIEQVEEVLLESLQSKQVHLVTYSVTFQL